METKSTLLEKITANLQNAYEDHDKGELIELLMRFEINGFPSKPLKKMKKTELEKTLRDLDSEMENR